MTKLIYSQVGYDSDKSKKAYFTGKVNKGRFTIVNAITKECVFEGQLIFWGEKWNRSWYIAEFSEIEKAGEYILQIYDDDQLIAESQTMIHIGYNILWNKCWYACSLGQLDIRAANSYSEGGWRDCGSELQEVSSHIIMLDSICDLLVNTRFPNCEREHLLQHLLCGTDYILCCQNEQGGFVHELHHNSNISFENCANAIAVIARVALLISKEFPDIAKKYLDAAQKGFSFIKKHDFYVEQPDSTLLQITHGATENMQFPPKQHRTRELLSLLSATISLYKSGMDELKENAVTLTKEILLRQIPKEEAEYNLYGHFYTYPGCGFSEKANYHCGAWDEPYKNYNQGTHKPYWVMPVFDMIELFPDHPDAVIWKEAMHKFAYGFFKPICKNSPFGIIPAGVYTNEGIIYFSGWYHGHAKIYGYAAAIAMKFYNEWHDDDFFEIATANMQWIAGLNCENISMIVDIGDNAVKDWNSLRGTIVNGFDASPQFRVSAVSYDTDLPTYLDDEGGIHHCAGFMTGLCSMNNFK